MPDVTATYAAVLGLMFIVLSTRVILARRGRRIAFGTGGDVDLERCIRIQGNFAEYVPMALVLLYFAELRGAPQPWLHGLCACLLLGRVAHAIGLSLPKTGNVGRVVGMTGTFTAIIGAAIMNLVL